MNQHLLKPWHSSLLIHASVLIFFIILTNLKHSLPEYIPVPIYEAPPAEVQNLTKIEDKPKVVLKSVNAPAHSEPKEAREVFGASRNAYTDESGDGIEAKKGNTLAKEADREILKDTDADALPVPTDEYLVSEMPSILSQVKPVYPKLAQDQKIEGSVEMDVLIDEKGRVRNVEVISGNEIFKKEAREAMMKFIFRPAKVDGKAVAVRIRYLLDFELEY